MNRRFNYEKIALVLTAVILGIFAVDTLRRLWIDWGNSRGKLTLHTSSSSVYEIEPGTQPSDESSVLGNETGTTTAPDESTPADSTTTLSSNEVTPPGDAAVITVQNSDVFGGSLMMINDQHPLTNTPAMTPFSSIKYEHIRLPNRGLLVNNLAIDSMVAMFRDFYASTGHGDVVMVYATTQAPSAPAYSVNIPERASGLSLDLSVLTGTSHVPFAGDGIFAWLPQHAADYGYILRYPADKADQTGVNGVTWHYRYVGVPHAKYMTDQNLCLEEYITLVRSHAWNGEHIRFTYDSTEYEVYYYPASAAGNSTDVQYPAGMEVSVSGDNIDGFIVTCSKAVG